MRLLIVIFFLMLFKGFSQDLNFRHISQKHGLVSNMVHDVLQDSDGFMWFGTEDGLSRYDGYSFLNFYQSPTDTLSLNNNLILSLAEDKNKQLWIGTHQGLNKLDLQTYTITRFNGVFKKSIGNFSIQVLYVDGNTLWIGTDNDGLFSLDINTYKVQHYQHHLKDEKSLSANRVNAIEKDPTRGLLIATSKGLDVLNLETSTFKKIVKNKYITDINVQQNGKVLLGIISESPHFLRLHKNGELEKIELPNQFKEKEIRVFSDSAKRIWVSVRDFGVFCFDKNFQKKQLLQVNNHNSNTINSNTITKIFEDSFGNIWISSFDAGINLLEKKRKNFEHVKDNFLPNGLLNNRVRAMYQDSEGDIWIGTKVNGTLSKFNRENLTFKHYHPNTSVSNSLSNDYIFSITEDKPGYLWVGTLDGLNLFDKNTGRFTVYKHQEGDVNSLSSNSINALLKDKDTLYIGTVTSGLDVYNTKTQTFSHYQKTGDSHHISDDRIKTIYKDSHQNIWVGTINGLNLFDVKTGTFQQFLNNPLKKNSISENYILSIHEDQHQNLWIGTSLGINLMDRETKTFKAFTTKDGLAGNSVRGILEDDEGNLWISTNNGLSKFNPITKEFKNYNVYDGLQANEFSKFVCCKTANGEMYFGGNNGFNVFHPSAITDNTLLPKVLLTNFKLFNQSVLVGEKDSPLSTHITKTKKIVLDHTQSVFSFEFVALNYSTPEKNNYAYKMEGFDSDWNYIKNKREASYTNLDAGTYVFRVKASNNDGYWNEAGTSVRITILPPPWKSWWAYIIYTLLFMLILWTVRQNAVKKNNYLRERELAAMKLKFFANISHEFRTPLTLIIAPLEKLLKTNNNTEQNSQLRLMSRHAKRLLSLVNQLLDFQKVGMGELTLQKQAGDLVQFTKELSLFFDEVSNDKNIQFICTSDIAHCYTMFDFDKMEKIIFNLLSNAFKFTPENGSITVKINVDKHNCIHIKVKDSGIGISADELPHIFKRFYQANQEKNDGNNGSGIGLAMVKEYVELHNGSITVESELGKGTCFVVKIPVIKAKENEVKNIDTNIAPEFLENNTKDFKEQTTSKNKIPLVLLVEDHHDLRAFLKANLKDHYQVIEASNGVEGIEQAKQHLPDMIISDVMMPKMDGNEFCSAIKNNPETSHIPVILLTAQTSEAYEVTGFKSGADQYITKPFNFEVLVSRINSLLKQRRALQQLFGKKLEVNPSEITVTSVDEQLIKKALELVEQNMSNSNYSVKELSLSLEITRGHLYRKMNAITGKSPSDFIKSIRLKRAAQLLKSSSLTISEIAYQVGFSNPKYFSKCFKIEFKELPSEYAARHK